MKRDRLSSTGTHSLMLLQIVHTLIRLHAPNLNPQNPKRQTLLPLPLSLQFALPIKTSPNTPPPLGFMPFLPPSLFTFLSQLLLPPVVFPEYWPKLLIRINYATVNNSTAFSNRVSKNKRPLHLSLLPSCLPTIPSSTIPPEYTTPLVYYSLHPSHLLFPPPLWYHTLAVWSSEQEARSCPEGFHFMQFTSSCQIKTPKKLKKNPKPQPSDLTQQHFDKEGKFTSCDKRKIFYFLIHDYR